MLNVSNTDNAATASNTMTGATIADSNADITPHDSTNVVILGDSQSWIGGDNCDKPRGWNKWFKDMFRPASCKSYARSGATWTNTPQTIVNTEENTGVLADNNVIFNQVKRLEEALKNGSQVQPQLIIIAAGTNDAWFGKQRPQRFYKTAAEVCNENGAAITKKQPSEILTLAEAVCYNCTLLRQLCPDAMLVLLTPTYITKTPDSMVDQAAQIIDDCAAMLGLQVIRMDKHSGIDSAKERKTLRLTTDGVHTSEEGARRNGTIVAKQIDRMMRQEGKN